MLQNLKKMPVSEYQNNLYCFVSQLGNIGYIMLCDNIMKNIIDYPCSLSKGPIYSRHTSNYF